MRWFRKRSKKLLAADARVEQAEADMEEAKQVQDEARELNRWAEGQNKSNRFDLRLQNAYKLQAGRD